MDKTFVKGHRLEDQALDAHNILTDLSVVTLRAEPVVILC
jgi:hypothetical protein